tara:strand:- start:1983 stop:4349 length:2367 start_codon:yes stop_codon:yes gene_type:complete
MGLDKVIVRSLGKVAKDTSKLNGIIDDIKDKIVSKGLELVEEAGIDTTQLPVDISQYLRGESPRIPSSNELINTETICNQPALTTEQIENTTRLANQAQIEIEQIYATTNRIKESLLDIKKPVNTINNTVQPLETTINAVDTAVKGIKKIPIPVAFGMPAISLPVSVLTTFSSTLDSLDKLIGAARQNLKTVPATLESMTNLINGTITKLNGVEQTLDPFVKTLTLVKSVAQLREFCPTITSEDIEDVRNNLLDNITGNLAVADAFNNPFAIDDEGLEESLQESEDPGFMYKNFKFVLEYDPDNEFFFPSRRIKCTRRNSTGFIDNRPGGGTIIIYNINPQTNPNLPEGDYSYSGDLRVLVEEAKFAVDTYTSDITLWSAPQVREQVAVSSSVFIDTDDEAYLEAYEEATGFLPSLPNQPLPAYIRYGTTIVNLNSSPTDIESGQDRLRVGFVSPDITSYIQSGTIQVNKPIRIRLKTFGGSGDPSDGYVSGFTESLLTIKRSFSIQDDIDPFTGRVAGFNQDAIDDFIEENGAQAITILDSIYETMFEVTNEFEGTGIGESEGFLYYQGTFIMRLARVFERLQEDEYFADAVEILYTKSKPLLYNEPLLWLSQRLFGTKASVRTDTFLPWVAGNSGFAGLLNVANEGSNWYQTARANSVGEDVGSGNNISDKAATLGMFYLALLQFQETYTNLYGSRADYNNGAWVGAASTLPIIPSTVGDENDDIEISLQATQLAGRNETINEEVGDLVLLGTYTYDLEIIDSSPGVGGPDTNYPTNFTQFFIEVI